MTNVLRPANSRTFVCRKLKFGRIGDEVHRRNGTAPSAYRHTRDHQLSHRDVFGDGLRIATGVPGDSPAYDHSLGRPHRRNSRGDDVVDENHLGHGERLARPPQARRPFCYALSAINKLLFPLASDASTVLLARIIDRVGKGSRDAPRDAFLTDVTPMPVRGSGFGLRITFYTSGFIVGPLIAILLMKLTSDNFRLVFWVAVIPAAVAILVLLVSLKEPPRRITLPPPKLRIRRSDLACFPNSFWWAIVIASLLSLARFSNAFLVLKASDIGNDAAFVPIMLVLMHVIYACAAYPFGVLADHFDRRVQLGMGAIVLIAANVILVGANTVWMTALGVALWGLQMGVTQGLLSASVADAAPEQLRGTAFGIYELTIGVATFAASAAAGTLWMSGGPGLTFGISAAVATTVLFLLLLWPMPQALASHPERGQVGNG